MRATQSPAATPAAVRNWAFKLNRDTPAFANETVFAYPSDDRPESRSGVPYKRRCFVLCRSVLQFSKFARFRPDEARPGDGELRKIIRRICRTPTWATPTEARMVTVPGFASFNHLSCERTRLVQEELGGWLPAYVRVGNWRMAFPFPRAGQRRLAQKLAAMAESGQLSAVYVTRFHRLNHCLIVYGATRAADGDIQFLTYDPNLPGAMRQLMFNTEMNAFMLPKSFYFPGGVVNALVVFTSPIH